MFQETVQKASGQRLSFPVKMHGLKKTGTRRNNFKCKVSIDFVNKNFRVRTIDSFEDFLKVLELRHRVFQKEFAGKKFCLRSDRDKYDKNADFLVVEDIPSGEIVGCYRVICSKFSDTFYTGSEFDISSLNSLPLTMVELSRAAISKEYRNGRIINLLWRGIAAYINATGSDLLFGCGSIQTLDANQINAFSDHFEKNDFFSEEMFFQPKKKYRLGSDSRSSDLYKAEMEVTMPPLMRTYLKAGAKICSAPALDRKFKCTDFMVVLETKSLQKAFKEKYIVN